MGDRVGGPGEGDAKAFGYGAVGQLHPVPAMIAVEREVTADDGGDGGTGRQGGF